MGGTKPPKLKVEDDDKTYIQRQALKTLPYVRACHCRRTRVSLSARSPLCTGPGWMMQGVFCDAGQHRSSGDQHSQSHLGLKGPIGRLQWDETQP